MSDLETQYRDDSNLSARASIYDYATEKSDWFGRVFDSLAITSGERVLEVGCGNGMLWQKMAARLPAEVSVLCSDLSPGMVEICREALGNDARFEFAVADAQKLEFEDGRFEVVVANHMLYHTNDVPKALSELHRVLTPGGRLCAATNGPDHMGEIKTLARTEVPDWGTTIHISRFDLSSGPGLVGALFDGVSVDDRRGTLRVTDSAAVVNYLLSMPERILDETLARLKDKVDAAIVETGAFSVTAQTGLITARR